MSCSNKSNDPGYVQTQIDKRQEEIWGSSTMQCEDTHGPSCPYEDQRQQPLKSSNGKSSQGEKSQRHLRESSSALKHLPNSLLDELFAEVLRDLLAEVFRSAMKDFIEDYLTRAAISDSIDGIVTEVVQMVLSAFLREALQELEYEAILQEVISHVVEEDAKALAQSVLCDYDAEMIKLQQSQITAFASKQLIDLFLLEHLIGMTSTYPPGFWGKEHSSVVLLSWMFDILIRQFFSIQEQQQTTSENVPLGDFHQKAFTEVALDVILTELSKLAEEDLEDLLEYERGVQTGLKRMNRQHGSYAGSLTRLEPEEQHGSQMALQEGPRRSLKVRRLMSRGHVGATEGNESGDLFGFPPALQSH
ncbi:uncharacterized protein LOC128823168 isoform X1 [Malaclemys terrapin pileata]|uniref:uncharacterized protein LOC128823168 isoform X1 n=1 Tax=Malaclemys terrapin pileata TaxID=2991368 RepID=UPI0023A7B06E|nr:uncharacterized protein LOC128823168 isoform X1 [Malaclemys terrapin pileata]